MAEKKPFGPKSEKTERNLLLGKGQTDPDANSVDGNKLNAMAKSNRRDAKKKLMVKGDMASPRYDRPGRRYGGRVGADRSPLSEAARPVGDTD